MKAALLVLWVVLALTTATLQADGEKLRSRKTGRQLIDRKTNGGASDTEDSSTAASATTTTGTTTSPTNSSTATGTSSAATTTTPGKSSDPSPTGTGGNDGHGSFGEDPETMPCFHHIFCGRSANIPRKTIKP